MPSHEYIGRLLALNTGELLWTVKPRDIVLLACLVGLAPQRPPWPLSIVVATTSERPRHLVLSFKERPRWLVRRWSGPQDRCKRLLKDGVSICAWGARYGKPPTSDWYLSCLHDSSPLPAPKSSCRWAAISLLYVSCVLVNNALRRVCVNITSCLTLDQASSALPYTTRFPILILQDMVRGQFHPSTISAWLAALYAFPPFALCSLIEGSLYWCNPS